MKHYSGHVAIQLVVNGESHEVVVRPADTLLRVLREKLGLTGTKIGCENGDCGVCTVLVNGKPVKSCMILAVEVEGGNITTIEGLKDPDVQKAFLEEGGFRCGFCTSGFLVNVHALLETEPEPDEATIREWMQSNLCRCTDYENIHRAVNAAIHKKKEKISEDK